MKRSTAPCGTTRGYWRHRTEGTHKECQACLNAVLAYQRDLRRRKRPYGQQIWRGAVNVDRRQETSR